MKTLTCLLTLALGSGPLFAAAPVHVVKTGDTLYSIALANNLTPAKLAELNRIEDRSTILIGQKLTLRASGAAAPSAAQTSKPASGSYTVVRGDTFYSIARRHELSVPKLKSYNPSVDVTHIVVGQNLATKPGVNPTPAPSKVASAKVASAKKPAISSRTVTVKNTTPVKKAAPKPVAKAAPKPAPVQVSKPAPKPTPAPAPKPEPKKEVVTKSEDPAPAPRDEVVKPPASVKSIIITSDTRFEDFSKKYGVSTQDLNKLNGWNLPATTILANGSEVFVPKG